MGYLLPSYEDLGDSTSGLLKKYNTMSARYITPNLEILFNNTLLKMEEYIKSAGDRITQAKALKQLVLELKSDEHYIKAGDKKDKTDKDKIIIANTQQVMLGALIHRYLRIIDEYKAPQKTVSLFGGLGDFVSKKVYNPVPTNSDIFNAIEGILNITAKNKLDPMTIKTSCESFFAYMQQENKYIDYVHYKDDANFFTYLQGFIDKATLAASATITEIKTIQFLMSLAKNIQNIHQDLNGLLMRLEKQLTEKDLPLNTGVIYGQLKNFAVSAEVGTRFSLLIDRPYVAEKIDKWTIGEFMQEMLESLDINSRYALFGGYMVIFQQIKDNSVLKKTLASALKCVKTDNELDNDSILQSLKFLKQWFMKVNIESATVDWTLFDGEDVGKDVFFAQYTLTKSNLTTNKPDSSQVKATI